MKFLLLVFITTLLTTIQSQAQVSCGNHSGTSLLFQNYLDKVSNLDLVIRRAQSPESIEISEDDVTKTYTSGSHIQIWFDKKLAVNDTQVNVSGEITYSGPLRDHRTASIQYYFYEGDRIYSIEAVNLYCGTRD